MKGDAVYARKGGSRETQISREIFEMNLHVEPHWCLLTRDWLNVAIAEPIESKEAATSVKVPCCHGDGAQADIYTEAN